jgi:RNA polymerase sigma-70 factor (ECF subfamily)
VSEPVNAQSEAADAARQRGLEDARWVTDAVKGNQDAFDRLVERYQRRAVSVAYRLLGNVDDAHDAAQDAFLRAYRNLATLEDPRRFGGWLLRIVTNLSLNLRRTRNRSATVANEELIAGEDRLRTPAGGKLTQAAEGPEAAELSAAIRMAIDTLPEKQRTALVLFSIEGIPQKEVAQIMNCTVELVKWNVFQARKTLRRMLAEHLD